MKKIVNVKRSALTAFIAAIMTLVAGCNNKDDKMDVSNQTSVTLSSLDKAIVDFDDITYLEYYDKYNGGADKGSNFKAHDNGSGNVVKIPGEFKNNLIDATSQKKLVSEYDTISEPFYAECYDGYNGGLDKKALRNFKSGNKGNGYVYEVTRDNKKSLVDASDFTVLIEEYEMISEPFYLEDYEAIDKDSAKFDGYVCEVTNNGTKYLVDAGSFIKVSQEYPSDEVGKWKSLTSYTLTRRK